MPPSVDPLVVEYLRQRDGSKVRRWRDVETGMCMTLVALDPIRDAVFKKAFDAHLNALRADGTTAGMTWRQVEVEAFMRTIAAGVRPAGRASKGPATGGTPADLGELSNLRTAATVNVSPVSPDAESHGAGDLRRDHARPAARRLLRPRVVRDERRSGACRRRRCGACCATPWSTRRCWAVRARCSTQVGLGGR